MGFGFIKTASLENLCHQQKASGQSICYGSLAATYSPCCYSRLLPRIRSQQAYTPLRVVRLLFPSARPALGRPTQFGPYLSLWFRLRPARPLSLGFAFVSLFTPVGDNQTVHPYVHPVNPLSHFSH